MVATIPWTGFDPALSRLSHLMCGQSDFKCHTSGHLGLKYGSLGLTCDVRSIGTLKRAQEILLALDLTSLSSHQKMVFFTRLGVMGSVGWGPGQFADQQFQYQDMDLVGG